MASAGVVLAAGVLAAVWFPAGRGSGGRSVSSRRRWADTAPEMNDGTTPTTLSNAPDRALRCCRNSTIVP